MHLPVTPSLPKELPPELLPCLGEVAAGRRGHPPESLAHESALEWLRWHIAVLTFPIFGPGPHNNPPCRHPRGRFACEPFGNPSPPTPSQSSCYCERSNAQPCRKWGEFRHTRPIWSAAQHLDFVKNYGHLVKSAPLATAESFSSRQEFYDYVLEDETACGNIAIVAGHLYGTVPKAYPAAAITPSWETAAKARSGGRYSPAPSPSPCPPAPSPPSPSADRRGCGEISQKRNSPQGPPPGVASLSTKIAAGRHSTGRRVPGPGFRYCRRQMRGRRGHGDCRR